MTAMTSTSMSKTFIGGALCQEFEWEAPAAEEMLYCLVCGRKQFSFYRAMHYSAKRGIAIACRLSVCDVGGS